MIITAKELPRYIDISAVKTNISYDEVFELARYCKKYNFICAFTMPNKTQMLAKLISESNTMLGAVTGFPSGADCTEDKVNCAKRMKEFGCKELDTVIDVGALISGDHNTVYQDLKAVVDCVYPIPVKSIIEVGYLTNEQITTACKIAIQAGVTFVKTGTGWSGVPTTVEHIKLIKSVVKDDVKIKAAGGVRSLEVLENMAEEGCERFGIGVGSAIKILEEAYTREGLKI